jgi:MFS family permease
MKIVLPDTLRALRSRNYRLFFTAQTISLSGLWMHRVAMGWLVYRLTNSNGALGIMDFAASLPIFLFTTIAGSMIERHDLRKVLVICQAICMSTAMVLAFLTLTNIVTFHIVLFMSLLLGLVDAFELPCRYSLVSYMVDRKEDISNAVALNSTVFNVARMIGPTIAGFVIHAVGEGICFFLNGMAYFSTIAAVKLMKMDEPPIGRRDGKRVNPVRDTLDGIKIISGFPPAKYILQMVTVTGFLAFPCLVLMPAMARSVLNGTSRTLGLLMMGVAIGALVGSLIMASLKSPSGLGRMSSRMCLLFGIAVAIFSLSPNAAFGVVFAIPVGFAMSSSLIACNTLLQTMAPPSVRSRVMSLYTLAVVGIPPFGSLVFGRVGDIIGTDWSLMICGLLCIATSFYFMKRLDRHNISIIKELKRRGVI